MVLWAHMLKKDELMVWPVSMYFDIQAGKDIHLHRTGKFSRAVDFKLDQKVIASGLWDVLWGPEPGYTIIGSYMTLFARL